MFESAKPKPAPDKPLEGRADLRKQVDASYYGYNLDEEDGTLLAYEAAKEKEAFENLTKSGEGETGGYRRVKKYRKSWLRGDDENF